MGKNIVVLSDGTGNSAAKANKTNIWRLYQALDKGAPEEQVVLYDDGVGTSGGRVERILGGALGLGLKRNVIELYDFLARTYNPGDRIYLFGFSRGAYTVRTLAAMIWRRGLAAPEAGATGSNSLKAATREYDEYRKSFEPTVLRRLFGKRMDTSRVDHRVEIEFMGVWDTVDAYGLPSDEFAEVWHNWVYPIYFPDRDLSPIVKRACHALAIDDERQTFHPLLWNEAAERPDQHGEERIHQVWFAGMHSDVGGGYFRNGLAHVSLLWMIEHIERTNDGAGLKFVAEDLERMGAEANPHGQMHDSRAGKNAFYRYRPRIIHDLSNDTVDPKNQVRIDTPKIHASVFERIRKREAPYAPIGLPETYEVVTPMTAPAAAFESAEERRDRMALSETLQNIVFWRQPLYFALFLAAVLLLAAPLLLPTAEDHACGGIGCVVAYVLESVQPFVPGYLHRWLQAFAQNPIWLGVAAVAGVALMRARRWAFLTTEWRATRAWGRLKGAAPATPSNGDRSWTARLRRFFDLARRKRIATIQAYVIGALAVIAAIVMIDRGLWEARDIAGFACTPSEQPTSLIGVPRVLTFDAADPCYATGLPLARGQIYRICVAPENGVADCPIATKNPREAPFDWSDGAIAAGPAGFDDVLDEDGVAIRLATPFRRHWSEPWFKLMGRVGQDGEETFPIGAGPAFITPKRDGELFLYVNDATVGAGLFGLWSLPYRWGLGENAGKARITVEAQ